MIQVIENKNLVSRQGEWFSKNEVFDKVYQLIQIPTGPNFVAKRLVGIHLAVAGSPELFRFRVQPDHPAAFGAHFIQEQFTGIVIVGAGRRPQ